MRSPKRALNSLAGTLEQACRRADNQTTDNAQHWPWGRSFVRGSRMSSVFDGLSDATIARLIGGAECRVLFAGPSVQLQTATALAEAIGRLGRGSIRVVLDVDEKVFRLG